MNITQLLFFEKVRVTKIVPFKTLKYLLRSDLLFGKTRCFIWWNLS